MDPVFNFWQASITDWIQAVAALIAVFSAIFGAIFVILDYRKRNREQEQQIKEVVVLAKGIGLQTEAVREANKINSEMLSTIANIVIDNRDYKDKLSELEKQKWKNSIKPIFNYSIGQRNLKYIGFELINVGETATLKNLAVLEQNLPVEAHLFDIEKKNMPKGDVRAVSITRKNNEIDFTQIKFIVLFSYSDIAGNTYTIFINIDKLGISLSEPKEVPDEEDSNLNE